MRPTLLATVAIAAAVLAIGPAAVQGVVGDFSQPPTSPEDAGPAPLSVTAANLNGDAFTDLVTTDFDASYDAVDIMLGSSSGNFTEPASSPEAVGDTGNSSAAADFDGDADTDLAVVNGGLNNVTILLNNGAGNFTEAGSSPEATSAGPISIVAARLDADADIDLAVVNGDDSNVTVMSNIGGGNFDFLSSPIVGADPRSIVAGTFDGDADNDLAIANRDEDDVRILINNGAGTFTMEDADVTVGDEPQALALGNFDGAATIDLAVANQASDNVTILLGDGTGEFDPAGTEAVGDRPRSLVAANLGGSAATDLAVANADSDNVTILFGAGNGGFSPAGTSPESVGNEPFSIAAGAFGGGSGIDLATANPEGGDVSILLNDAVTARCGGKAATIVGTNGKNKLRGTNKADVIAGLGGNDTIRGRGGKDILCGAAGKDKLIGGKGKDKLIGGKGKDTLRGGPGKDKLKGGPGRDRQIQ